MVPKQYLLHSVPQIVYLYLVWSEGTVLLYSIIHVNYAPLGLRFRIENITMFLLLLKQCFQIDGNIKHWTLSGNLRFCNNKWIIKKGLYTYLFNVHKTVPYLSENCSLDLNFGHICVICFQMCLGTDIIHFLHDSYLYFLLFRNHHFDMLREMYPF